MHEPAMKRAKNGGEQTGVAMLVLASAQRKARGQLRDPSEVQRSNRWVTAVELRVDVARSADAIGATLAVGPLVLKLLPALLPRLACALPADDVFDELAIGAAQGDRLATCLDDLIHVRGEVSLGMHRRREHAAIH